MHHSGHAYAYTQAVFFPGPFSIVAPPTHIQQPYFFDVVTKMIDVVTNSAQTTSIR